MNGKKIAIEKYKCPQDHPCPILRICPAGAVSQQGFSAPEIDQDKCTACGKCTKYCPYGAFTYAT